MRKLLIFSAVLVLLYGFWVTYPPERNRTELQRMRKVFVSRFEAGQKDAKRTQLNGYLDPRFLGYWGRKNEADPNHPLRAVIKHIEPYNAMYYGKDTGLGLQLSQGVNGPVEAFAAWEPYQRALHEVAEKPTFQFPQDQLLNYVDPTPNLLRFRELAYATAAYSEFLMLRDQADKAYQPVLDSLRLNRKLQDWQGGYLYRAGVQFQSTAQSALGLVLEHSTTVPAIVPQVLEQTQSVRDQIFQSEENEFIAILNVLDSPKALNGPLAGGKIMYLPGVRQREVRMFKNEYIEVLQASRAGTLTQQQIEELEKFNVIRWFMGRGSYWTSMMAFGSAPERSWWEDNHRRQAFLHLFATLRLQPKATLQSLQASGYKGLDGLDWKQLRLQRKGQQLELTWDIGTPGQSPRMGGQAIDGWPEVIGSTRWVLRYPRALGK